MSAEQAEVLAGLEVYPLEVHGLRIGPLGFIGVPLEPFIELGTAIVAASPFGQTFVSGYTNGYRNYLPTIDQWPRGGYEVDICAFRPEAATLLVESATRSSTSSPTDPSAPRQSLDRARVRLSPRRHRSRPRRRSAVRRPPGWTERLVP